MLHEQIGVIPAFDGAISQRVGRCLGTTEVVEVKSGHGQGILYVVHNRFLDALLVTALVLAHELPDLFIFIVIDLILQELRPKILLLHLLEQIKFGLRFVLVLRPESF